MKNIESELPDGFGLVRFEGGVSLAIPTAHVAGVRDEFRRRIEERESAARQEAKAKLEAQRDELIADGKKAAATRDKAEKEQRLDLQLPPQPGWYRVLPNLQRLVNDVNFGEIGRGIMEAERATRRTRLLEDILDRGPDRRLAHNAQWRQALDELEATMPNFAGPIRVVREALLLSESGGQAVRIPPILLLGQPGLGKSYFANALANLLGTSQGVVSFDQPTGGTTLRGLDAMWANASAGLLFHLCLHGEYANPVVVLEELDKSGITSANGVNPLSQLLGALESETAQRTVDVAVDVEFDASMVTYIATANSAAGLSRPLLSRFEVFTIGPCRPQDADRLASQVAQQVLKRLGLHHRMSLNRRAVYMLAHLPPRQMKRLVERAAFAALESHQVVISDESLWRIVEPATASSSFH